MQKSYFHLGNSLRINEYLEYSSVEGEEDGLDQHGCENYNEVVRAAQTLLYVPGEFCLSHQRRI